MKVARGQADEFIGGRTGLTKGIITPTNGSFIATAQGADMEITRTDIGVLAGERPIASEGVISPAGKVIGLVNGTGVIALG